MKRGEFMAGTATLLVSPLSARPGERRRIGFLAKGDGTGQALNQTELALLEGPRNHG